MRYRPPLPERFRTLALNNEKTSEDHHGAKPSEARLSAARLKQHGAKLVDFLGCAAWTETASWQPFMADLSALGEGMEKLARAMAKTAAAVEQARRQSEPPRAPERDDPRSAAR